jgi:ribosomal protein S18 acetylase RimI-like enzyme
MTFNIALLDGTASAAVIDGLAALLVDAVESGATVSFLAGVTHAEAAAWWTSVLAGRSPRSIVLIAHDADGVVGTVQIDPAWAPNQRHRGEVAKLLVHRRARRRGLGRALMRELERRGRAAGFRLLMLNTRKGDAGEPLYVSLGWTRLGEVPGYALDPAGVAHPTVLFYKEL